MAFNIYLHRLQSNAFDIIVYLTWFLYLLIFLGLSANAPQYLDMLQLFVKLYVSLFLIYRFNPLRHVKFTSLDAKITFSAGLFLLGTTLIDRGLTFKYF